MAVVAVGFISEVFTSIPMSNDPIDLNAHRRHFAAKVVCLACKHQWIGVAAVGATDLECPECKCPRGVWHYPLTPAQERKVFQCKCGCCAFYVLQGDQIMCMGCGQHTQFPL